MNEYDEADEQLWGEAPPRDAVDAAVRENDPFFAPRQPIIRRCGHKVGFRATDYGSAPIYCHQSVGLVTWTDVHGERRWGCGKHRDSLMRRYPLEMSESEHRLMDANR